MPSLPDTIYCRMPSRSPSGSTTIFQAWKNAVWPVRPIIQESTSVTRVPGGPCRLALSAASRPPAPPPITSTSVSISTPSKLVIGLTMGGSPWPRPVLDRRMHVDDLLRAENLAAEARDAMFAELDDREQLDLPQPRHLGRDRRGLHVDHVGRADDVADAAARAFLDFDRLDHVIPRSARPRAPRAIETRPPR